MYIYLYVQFFLYLQSFSYIVPVVYSLHHKKIPFIYNTVFIYRTVYLYPPFTVQSPLYTAEITKIIFYIIILNSIMRITERFSLCYAEVGVGVGDFRFLIFEILKFKNEKGCACRTCNLTNYLFGIAVPNGSLTRVG